MAAPMSNKVAGLEKLVFERSSFLDKKDKHRECVRKQFFNSSIHVFLPGCSEIPQVVHTVISSEVAFLAEQLPLHYIIEQDFIHGFISEGLLCMVSHGTAIDVDNCIAVLPTGILVLNLNKETFQTFGIDGHLSTAGKNSGKYVVKIDLLSKQFLPGTKTYKRVKWCLNKLPDTDFLVTWQAKDPKVCPSSVQNYFRSHGVQCNRMKIYQTSHSFHDFSVPMLDPSFYSPSEDRDFCGHEELYEWLGACAVGIDSFDGDGYVSSYSCPYPSTELKNCIGSQYSGMFHPHTVQLTVDLLRTYLKEKKIAWCCVTAHGFMDSPVCGQFDHGFQKSGDNLYTFVIFQNDDYWLYSAMGAHDTCP